MPPVVRSFFDASTYSYTHVVSDPVTRQAAIIDPLADYDPVSATISTESADAVASYVQNHRLSVRWILETHIHADHLSAGPYLKALVGGQLGISSALPDVQLLLATTLGMEPQFVSDGSQFDCLLDDGQILPLGELRLEVLHTPGHTPACATFVCSAANLVAPTSNVHEAVEVPVTEPVAFVGDALFMPDFGTGRTDFPGGCARTLYRSIERILSLPANTSLFLCHDYGGETREGYCCTTSIEEARAHNVHLVAHPEEDGFVAFRKARDKALSLPGLFDAAVPYNLRGGKPVAPLTASEQLNCPLTGPAVRNR